VGRIQRNTRPARPKMWRNGDFRERARGGISVSTDDGRSWTQSNSGMDETAFTHILLDPASPAGKRTLYACGFGIGVYKSTDNGMSWQLKNDGIKEFDPFAWRIVRSDDGALYLIVARANEGRYGEMGGSGALYRSVDGAEHWEKIRLPEGVNGPTGLAVRSARQSPHLLDRLGPGARGCGRGGGVLLSTDGGQSWKPVFSQSQHVYDVTIDPKAPDSLYICGFDAAAFPLNRRRPALVAHSGYNFEWGHRVLMDPNDASKIYITTFGGSVWHGPASGDPTAHEDNVAPVPVTQ